MRKTAQDPSLADEAYRVVRGRIVGGEVAIGQVISRRKVAVELGMSFLPVSEAFLRLEYDGLLESRPRAGTRVRIPSSEDVRGHYIVRQGLEIQAARLFAEHATDEEHAELLDLARHLDMLSAQLGSDRSVYLTHHVQLHRKIAEYSRCWPLCDAIDKTSALSAIWLCCGGSHSAQSARGGHEILVEALLTRDPAQAGEAMRVHIDRGMQQVLERMAPYFELAQANDQPYCRSARKQMLI